MEKEGVSILAQLLTTLQDAILKLEIYYNEQDMEGLRMAKEEILALQMKIERLI
jgi:hypothetical protein